MKMLSSVARLSVLLALLCALSAGAQWSAQPGATVRDAFGPQDGTSLNQCRGACGAGCPASCAETVTFECTDDEHLRRVVTFACGTHPACRAHDDCLDACLQSGVRGGDCQTQCDADVVSRNGLEASASWLSGGGPYDGQVRYEYTRDAPDAPQPAYRCPEGSSRQCSGNAGCTAAAGTRVDPVFDSYPEAGSDAMQISSFRAGPQCGDRVCAQSATIRVTGADACQSGPCTRFGMEFDYRNADPAAPLECTTSTRGGESDFIGDLLKQGADAMTSRTDETTNQSDDGMAQLLGMFGKVLASADSPEDVSISMVPLDENGNPIESQRVGSEPANGPAPIPRTVSLPAERGHLFVPMYQLADDSMSGGNKERKIRCTHKGAPVLETVFFLQ
ncbi:MAG: hypothetical protein R3E86_06225 [Pseudomonadales bacterium]